MAYLTAWDASNKLYKRGSSDYPWCAGPGGHSRARAHVVLSWWKALDGRDPSPLPAVCPRLLWASTPLGDYTVPPRSKSQYWNNHKDKHLPLKQAWNRHVSSHPRLFSVLSLGGGCLNHYPSSYLSCLNQQEARKFVLWSQTVRIYSSFFLSSTSLSLPGKVLLKRKTKNCN